MKITKKILTASTVALFAMSSIVAQEFDDFGDDEFDSFEESSTPTLTWNGEAEVHGRAWLRNSKNKKNPGESGYQELKKAGNSPTDADASLKLEAKYSGTNTDAIAKLKFDAKELKDYPEDVIDDLTVRGYFGNWQLEAGKMRTVWGKGDKLHVLDNFNANNYTDFIFPDYIDRRLSEPMFKAVYASTYTGDLISNLKAEAVWTPMMTADRFAAEKSELYPYTQTKLTNTVMDIQRHNLIKAANTDSLPTNDLTAMVDAVMKSSSFTADDLYKDDIKTLKYGQAGMRLTGTFGNFDLGASYYYGHYKQPSASLEKYIGSLTKAIETDLTTTECGAILTPGGTPSTPYGKFLKNNYSSEIAALMAKGIDAATALKTVAKAHAAEYTKYSSYQTKLELPELNYDRLQVFGLEAAFILWKLNTRWEFAYNLTEDTAGDNPWIKNNSIAWLGGFDIDLPIHNLNVNIQEQGEYILKNDKIKDGEFATYDVNYNSDEKYTMNKLVVNISDKWLYEKLVTECTTIYVFETKEWCVQPKISYNVMEGLTFSLSGGYIYSNNENGQFYNFTQSDQINHKKAFAQFAAKYQF